MDFKNFYKYFINILFGLIFISLNIITRHANARNLSDLSPLAKTSAGFIEKNISIGAEYLYNFTDAKGDWHSIFKKSQPGADLYIGYNWPYIMLEVGYSWTTRKSKEFCLNSGDSLFGQTNDNSTVIAGQLRFRNTHFDLNLFASFTGDLDVITSIGFGLARPHITIHNSNPNSSIGDELTNESTKTSFIPRVGLGLRYLLSESCGLRAMWRFEKNSKIRLRTFPSFADDRPLRDGNTISFGFFTRI